MRGLVASLGAAAACAACLCAPVTARAIGPSARAAAQQTLPLWIDPQLLGAPVPVAAPTIAVHVAIAPVVPVMTASPPTAPALPRFTVTRVAADGSRSTRAIDASALQALGQPSVAVASSGAAVVMPPPVVAEAAPASARPPAPAVAPAPTSVATAAASGIRPASPDAAAIQAAAIQASARRLSLEPTWTALARRPLAIGAAEASALGPDGRRKTDGKAALRRLDGRRYGETGRFYMYAAMKNKGVGMNVVDHGESWGGDGLSYDQGGFAGQRSAGVGWRRGDVSTSLGWVHAKSPVNGLFGAPAEKDDRVSLMFTWRPSVAATAPPIPK